jgi:hypothetical protein
LASFKKQKDCGAFHRARHQPKMKNENKKEKEKEK